MRIGLLVLVLAFAACDRDSEPVAPPGPPRGYEFALAHRDCAPWDGAAVTVYLAGTSGDSLPPVGPYLRVALWVGLDSLAGRRFSLPADSREGAILECAAGDSCIPVPEGMVRISEVSPDNTISGELRVQTTAGDTIQGSFRARWRELQFFCG